jgi:hypothetical protein
VGVLRFAGLARIMYFPTEIGSKRREALVFRMVLAATLGLVSIVIIAGNWRAFVRRMQRKSISWVPLVGGVVGAAALLIAPSDALHAWWWLPLLFDWGSIPGITHALVMLALRRPRKPTS